MVKDIEPKRKTKPPLTRRWTEEVPAEEPADEQTSAHAEMDPFLEHGKATVTPNLRSRGDGPGCF